LSAFPRSAMSRSQVNTVKWFAETSGSARDLPTAKQVADHREEILRCSGADTTIAEGSLGNVYCVNNIAKIIAHEWANPLVRPHISDYPIDPIGDEAFDRAAHGARWLEEVDGNLSAPMVRIGKQDYFVYEPAVVQTGSGPRPLMVTRWFKRGNVLWGKAHPLLSYDAENTSYVIDACSCEEFKCDQLLLSYPLFKDLHLQYGWPPPDSIRGEWDICGANQSADDIAQVTLQQWNEPLPNRWRIKADGKRVFTPPVWCYCDDTSGNKSKKWNKHNSFLMTLAGLEPRLAHLMYNIHFLATSNVAPPLEMLEKIVDMLVDLRENGVVAYDCYYEELVLLAPWILGELGDNPMQSELSAHIGTRGRCYCRICCYNQGSIKDKDNSQRIAERKLTSFQTGVPRTKEATRMELMRQLQAVLDAAPTRISRMITATGVKDQYLDNFLQKLSAACSKEKKLAKESASGEGAAGDKAIRVKEALRALRETMPADLFNPGLRIPDLDPNADTPVEVLHTVLLGFVKYFWRDAISRQSPEGKERLKQRLSSLNVTDLGLPPLRGHNLVQWAGSLTGKDFRIIVQVAPAVLYDAVIPPIYETWLALGRLVPLIFRPAIRNLESYLVQLENAIDDFLACTALWNVRWFNKPKFHLLLHLPRHSYNAVIRLRSINSNRHAPGHDIAYRFSHLHATRHLLSGGIYFAHDDLLMARPLQAGMGVRNLLKDERLTHMMGMDIMASSSGAGAFNLTPKAAPVLWVNTLAYTKGLPPPDALQPASTVLLRHCDAVVLSNSDIAHIKSIVVLRNSPSRIARVEEILADADARHVVGIVITPWTVGQEVLPYRLPAIHPSRNQESTWVTVEVSRCFDPTYQKLETDNRKDIATVAHTFHNCSRNQCVATKTRRKTQERVLLADTVYEYLHNKEPDDLVLNLSQLRSASALDEFRTRTRYPGLPKDIVIARAMESANQDGGQTALAGRKTRKRAAPATSGVTPGQNEGSTAAS
ncbi:hypothetical protein K525DRAFT_149713, partial [Schizophyllum commune Loenen D]